LSGDTHRGAEAPPPLFYAAFVAGGPIVIGTITDVAVSEPLDGVERGRLALAVEKVLRGDGVGESLELPFERLPQDGRRPPVLWDHAAPEAGKHVCVILAPGPSRGVPPQTARCVFEVNGPGAAYLTVLERMVELESAPDSVRIAALDDPPPQVRALATELLLHSRDRADPEVRSTLFRALGTRARSGELRAEERLQAIGLLGFRVYDGFSRDDAVNYEVLSLLASLLADGEPRVRAQAAAILHGYLLGPGTVKPSPERITVDRDHVLKQLKRDIAAGVPFAAQAEGLRDVLEKSRP
jgi:hypothetical protein